MRGAEGAPVGRMSIMKCNLLGCGLVAGPLFIAASLTQAYTRKGFDLGRHPISLLSLGAPGWVQITNFVVCGILYVLGAAGLRQALRQSRGGTWGPLLIGATGVGLIIAGVFTADPGAGFPPGALTSKPSAGERIRARPARTMAWSSTRATWIIDLAGSQGGGMARGAPRA